MADYVAALKKDLVEQFRGKANIEALMEVIGDELQQVYGFYEQLRGDRSVYTATGKQLDGVGDIVALTRREAGLLAGNPIPFDIIDDETYRRYLIYKILKNTCDCTYPDIIKAFRMFWSRPLYYSEDPKQPATMIFDTGEMEGLVDTRPLFTTPLLRAAGVTLKLYARTRTQLDTAKLRIAGGLGYASTESVLPILERAYDLGTRVYVRTGNLSVAEDVLPTYERDYRLGFRMHLATGLQGISESKVPNAAQGDGTLVSGQTLSLATSVMETKIDGIVTQTVGQTTSSVAKAKLQNLRDMTARLAQNAANNTTIEGGMQK